MKKNNLLDSKVAVILKRIWHFGKVPILIGGICLAIFLVAMANNIEIVIFPKTANEVQAGAPQITYANGTLVATADLNKENPITQRLETGTYQDVPVGTYIITYEAKNSAMLKLFSYSYSSSAMRTPTPTATTSATGAVYLSQDKMVEENIMRSNSFSATKNEEGNYTASQILVWTEDKHPTKCRFRVFFRDNFKINMTKLSMANLPQKSIPAGGLKGTGTQAIGPMSLSTAQSLIVKCEDTDMTFLEVTLYNAKTGEQVKDFSMGNVDQQGIMRKSANQSKKIPASGSYFVMVNAETRAAWELLVK